MVKRIINFIVGMLILLSFYVCGIFITKLLKISFPPAIFGLILFSFCLIKGFVKEEWIKPAVDWLMNNMAMFLLPFMGGLVAYQSIVSKNILPILAVVFITTTVMIVAVGLFIEYGIAFLRLKKIKEQEHD